MREMEYKTKRCEPIILDEDDYSGYHYVILSLGTHPTAYVEKKRKYSEEELDLIYTHCGFTYGYEGSLGDDAYWNEDDHRHYLGWDYAHCNDYAGYSALLGYDDGKKWTTKEIQKEVYKAIDDFCYLEDARKAIAREIFRAVYDKLLGSGHSYLIKELAEEYEVEL